jgi:hydroxyethylthiazole kinase-like uncharacterized protein yjeF
MKMERRLRPRRTGGALVFSRDAVRQLDRLAVEKYGIPSIVLMENAAVHLAAAARRMVPRGARVVIFCGPGNNGGDGLAMARHLDNAGYRVHIVLSADRNRYAGDAAINLAIARAMGLKMSICPRRALAADLVVDALLGTGLDRPVGEPIAGLIRMVNRMHRDVLSVDIPSGLHADTGEPMGIAVKADVTVTMAGWKAGFTKAVAGEYLGRVIVADIGVPRELSWALATGGTCR